MRVKRVLQSICTVILITAASFGTLLAQPSPERLAEEVMNKNLEWLSEIETLTMTMQLDEGGMIPDMTTRYVKKSTEDGTPYLDIENEDAMEMDFSAMAGSVDQMAELIRGADSITKEDLNGVSTFRVFVDDDELLKSLDQSEIEYEEMEIVFDKATIWIESDKMFVRKVFLEQVVDGDRQMSIEVNMDEYEVHSGYPVPMKMTMQMNGMSSQFSEGELVEARKAMQEMEEQLKNMPEAQRRAIEEQIKPQMEQFERMLDSDEGMTMTMRVTDLKVNQ